MDSLVYGSNAQGEMPGNGGERGDMKGGPGNRQQPDADMEKPQGALLQMPHLVISKKKCMSMKLKIIHMHFFVMLSYNK